LTDDQLDIYRISDHCLTSVVELIANVNLEQEFHVYICVGFSCQVSLLVLWLVRRVRQFVISQMNQRCHGKPLLTLWCS